MIYVSWGNISRLSVMKQINELLWNKLPEWMDDKQRKNKVKNLIFELKTDAKIKNEGTTLNSRWVVTKIILENHLENHLDD